MTVPVTGRAPEATHDAASSSQKASASGFDMSRSQLLIERAEAWAVLEAARADALQKLLQEQEACSRRYMLQVKELEEKLCMEEKVIMSCWRLQ
jgi:hypothetical protein